jgi:hypothetical protein
MFRAIQKIREIKVGGIVPDNDIWVDFLKEVAPLHQHVAFIAE